MEKQYYRTVWISDIHLGTKASNVKMLDGFLNSFKCDTLYLVGDIIDGWHMRRGKTYFPQSHVDIIRKFLNKARKGTQIKYVIGNHDEFFRKFADMGLTWGNIEIADEFIHETADDRKLLIIHGDLYDGVVRYHKIISHMGDIAYNTLIAINRHFNHIRKFFNLPYWSLSSYLKHKVKGAVEFIFQFEQAVAKECKRRDLDGVVCGHIHHAEIRDIGGVMYYNDGDFVESCTALVEHTDGRMEIIQWRENTNEHPDRD